MLWRYESATRYKLKTCQLSLILYALLSLNRRSPVWWIRQMSSKGSQTSILRHTRRSYWPFQWRYIFKCPWFFNYWGKILQWASLHSTRIKSRWVALTAFHSGESNLLNKFSGSRSRIVARALGKKPPGSSAGSRWTRLCKHDQPVSSRLSPSSNHHRSSMLPHIFLSPILCDPNYHCLCMFNARQRISQPNGSPRITCDYILNSSRNDTIQGLQTLETLLLISQKSLLMYEDRHCPSYSRCPVPGEVILD